MLYHSSFYFHPPSQTQPQQQQQQQKSYRTPLPIAVQTAVPTAVQTSAPWHKQQAVYQPDFTTRYVYGNSNANPPTPPRDSLHSPANHQNNQTTASDHYSSYHFSSVYSGDSCFKSKVPKTRGNDLFSHTAVAHEQNGSKNTFG